ncbi:MAG: hypothetical protein U0X20_27495 [Caldilineaceae bacterium]
MSTTTSHISAELVRRAQERRLCPAVVATLAALGAAVDAGLIALPDLLDLVRSCSNTDDLGGALCMLATTATIDDWPPVGWPPAPPGRFRIVGEREEGDVWQRS